MMMIITPKNLNTFHIDQIALESNTKVSTLVLLFKRFSTRYISVTKTQTLFYLHQYIIITDYNVGWYVLHIIFQNSV
jgi:hypothetical protein